MTDSRERLLRKIVAAYLASPDFNGISVAQILIEFEMKWPKLREDLIALVREESIGILFQDTDSNTHILRFGFETADRQIKKLKKTKDLYHTCVYPSATYLRDKIDRAAYKDRPYTLEMALGEPQLACRFFDLSVLETYRNDPRYLYQTHDIGGSISVSDDYFESEHMLDRDQVLLQTFGFAYDADLNRVVAVFLRYLSDLSPEHQHIWKARELQGDFKLHPDYYRNNILGEWGERVSIFSALLVEQYIINEMAKAMAHPPLFRKDYGLHAEGKPKHFTFLVRPTLEELNAFILLLDKMLSENIDKTFFRGEVLSETELERADGKIEVRPRGSIAMLDEWIRKKFRTADWEPWGTAISVFREVRKLRQKPAHAVNENVFDQEYFRQQRELMLRAYDAVRTIRLMFANHPAAKKVEVPDWLFKGLIWDF